MHPPSCQPGPREGVRTRPIGSSRWCGTAARFIPATRTPTLPRDGNQLLGRIVERDHASARRASTTAACCGSPGHQSGIRLYAPREAPPRRAISVVARRHRPARGCGGADSAAAGRALTPSAGCATPCRSGSCQLRPGSAVPPHAFPARGSMAWIGLDGYEDEGETAPAEPYVFCRRSIPLSGIGADSSCSGDGRPASRRIPLPRRGSLAITRCRCSGGTRDWLGQRVLARRRAHCRSGIRRTRPAHPGVSSRRRSQRESSIGCATFLEGLRLGGSQATGTVGSRAL